MKEKVRFVIFRREIFGDETKEYVCASFPNYIEAHEHLKELSKEVKYPAEYVMRCAKTTYTYIESMTDGKTW